jgi:hypothetical protein
LRPFERKPLETLGSKKEAVTEVGSQFHCEELYNVQQTSLNNVNVTKYALSGAWES